MVWHGAIVPTSVTPFDHPHMGRSGPFLVLLLILVGCATASVRDTSFVKFVHVSTYQPLKESQHSDNKLLVSMNHLDVGFDGIMPIVGFGYNVVNKYFDVRCESNT